MIITDRIRRPFQNTMEYFEFVRIIIGEFLGKSGICKTSIIGVGFSLPGIVDKEQKVLIRSHTLRVEHVSFKNLGNSIGFPYELENDANSVAYAELDDKTKNAVYLSLSNTVGGAIYLQEHLYKGEKFVSAEFEHEVIERNGKHCYCGKKGCMDAYCSAKILQQYGGGSLEGFFEKMRNRDTEVQEVWKNDLDFLSIGITNLRMIIDLDTAHLQTGTVFAVLKHSFTTVPDILWMVTAVVLFFYRLNRTSYNKIVKEIQERKAG